MAGTVGRVRGTRFAYWRPDTVGATGIRTGVDAPRTDSARASSAARLGALASAIAPGAYSQYSFSLWSGALSARP